MLKRSLIALAVCVVAAGSAQSQFQERTFRVSNGVSRDHPMGNGLAKMSECTLAKSGGKMKIQSYWDGALGSDLTATQQVRTGSLEMVLTSTAPLVGIVPALGVFDLPFLFIFVAIMFYYSLSLTLIVLGILGVIVALSLTLAPVFQRRLNEQFLLGARNQAFVTEYVSGLETVKSLQLEPHISERYHGYLASYLGAGFRMKQIANTYNVAANIGAPQVAYREKITRPVTHDYVHKKQTGGHGQFARVKIVAEPNEPGKGFEFESKVVGGAVPKEFIPGVEKGLNSVLGSGVVAGFPVVDVKVQLVDGKYHDVDSSALAFEIASRAAFRDALQKGKSVLLEPIMKVEVVTPEDYTGSVIGDLNSRRGQIQGQDMRGNANVINAMVPLMNMFGYVNNLRSMSQGRATFTMQFDHYAEAPANVSAEVQKKFA